MIAAKNHKNGVANPYAQMRKDFGYEFCRSESEKNPFVAGPLKRTDCSLVSDGAAALVLADAETAKSMGKAVNIRATAHAQDFLPMSKRDILQFEGCTVAWQRALQSAGVQLSDLSFVETHDCFTVAELIEYEAMGLTPRGQGARAIKEGWTQKDGKLPINPSGGLKAKGHPIGATGVSMHVMTAMQLSVRRPRACRSRTPNSAASSTWVGLRSPIMSRCWSPRSKRLEAMNVAEWLAASARLRPDAPALLTGFDLDADYATFARRAAAIGAALSRDHGIAPGDRVGLFATNCTQYLECLYGIWWIGAVAIPINAKLHGREAAWICSDAGAKLTFVSDDTAEALMEAKDDLPPAMKTLSVDSDAYRAMREGEGEPAPLPREVDDLAWLFYTSGTTGRPKGVMLSHGNLVAMSLCYLADVDRCDAERCLALRRADFARRGPL